VTGGYQPDWDVDKARGEEAEALFRKLRTGIIAGTTEVKRDDRARETGNFYIELECQRFDGWHDSGLRTTKATAWAIVCWPVVLAVPVSILRIAVEGAKAAECRVGSHPTRGVVVPMGELVARAVAAANAPLTERKAA
jgi:hypothetical protein